MEKQVTFNVIPTTNPDEVIGDARTVVNTSTGIGMDVLKQIIEEHIPVVDDEQVLTEREIIRTDRYECPCCHTELTALVNVYCRGKVTDEWNKVTGLYRVEISHDFDQGGCKVIVEKLTGTKIYLGHSDHLPRKHDYANPEARKIIDERNAAITKAIQENPGRVACVTLETRGDLNKLAGAIAKVSPK